MNIHFFNSLSSSLVDIKDQFLRPFAPQNRQITAIAIVAIAGIAALFFAIRYCLKRNAKNDEKDIEAQKDKAAIKDDKKKIEKRSRIQEAVQKRLQTQGQNREKLLANKKDDAKTQEEKDAKLARKLAEKEDGKIETDEEMALRLSLEEGNGGDKSQETDEEMALRLSLEDSKGDLKEATENDEEVARKLAQELTAAEEERANAALIKELTEQDLKDADKGAVDKEDKKEDKDIKPALAPVPPAAAKAIPKGTPVPAPAKAAPKGTPAPAPAKAAPAKDAPLPAPAPAKGAPAPVDEKKGEVVEHEAEPEKEIDSEKAEAERKKKLDEARKKANEARQAELNKKSEESQIKAPNPTPIPKAVHEEDEEIEKESEGEEKDLGAGAGNAGADIAGGEKHEPDPIPVIDRDSALEGKDPLDKIFTEGNPVYLKSNIKNYFDKGGSVESFLGKISNEDSYLNCLWEVLGDYQSKKVAIPSGLSPEAITTCLKKHAELVGCKNLEELLEFAIKKKAGTLIKILLQQGLDLNAYVESSGNTYLMAAVRVQDEPLMGTLISKGANVNQPGKDGTTPLELALHENYVEVAKALIVLGAKVNKQSPYEGNTALHLALANGLPSVNVQALILATDETVINTPNDKLETALLLAVRRNDQILVNDLVKKGAKATDEMLLIALNPANGAAVRSNLIDTLVKNGANPNCRDLVTNKTPLEFAKSHPIVKQILINNGADPKIPFSDRSNVIEEPAPKVEDDTKVEQKEEKEEIEAEREESADDVREADEETESEIEVTKSELSSEEAEAKQRAQFLEDIFKEKDSKAAAPHIQAYLEASGTVKEFIEALSTHNIEPIDLLRRFEIFCTKYTELYATEEMSTEEIKQGLEACAHSLKSNLTDLLEVAINQRNVWAIQQICAQNLDLNTPATKSGNTALITAVKSKAAHRERWAIIDLLMKSGKADINKTARDGMTPLMTAVVKGDSEDVRSLILTGADVNQAVDQELEVRTPLEYTLDKKQWDMAKILISSGATSERHMPNKGSALHLAIVNGLVTDAIIELAKNGAKFDLTDKDGKTVINLICDPKYSKLLPSLAKYIDLEAAIKSGYPVVVSEVLKLKPGLKAEASDLWLALKHARTDRADRTDIIIEQLVEKGGLDLESQDSDSNKTLKELAIEEAKKIKNLKVQRFLENYKKKPATT